jgi:uncharacterized protein YkwD
MEKIKKWVLPNRKNNHHPHLLRPLGLSLVLALVLVSNIAYNYTTAREMQVLGYATSISSSEIINLSNQERAGSGLGALTYNAQLTQAAQAKAQDMFAQDYWSHYNPQGNGPAYFMSNAGYSYSAGGENLAKDFNTSAGVVNAWMNSAGHRANILKGSYIHTGVAVVNGNFQGTSTTIVVAMYGTPTSAPAPAPAATTKPAAPAPAPATSPQPESSSSTQTSTPPVATKPPAQKPSPESTKNKSEPKSANETVSPANDQIKGAMSESVTIREKLNWAQNSTMVILSTLLLITALKHTLVWRTNRRGWRHIWFRAHPAAQYTLIIVAIVSTLSSSVGAIL